jgi:hypothetical protein
MLRPFCAPSTGRLSWSLNVAVAALILISAAALYLQFRQAAPSLWDSACHDRNGHYARSLNVAIALRHGSLARLVQEVHAATVWPPLHPLLTGLVLAVGGLDYRFAVLTSLGAWAATCWFAFALGARLVPRYRALAGGVALVFALASPAYRAYAADIMIESLGAGLTLAALYFYVTARQESSAWRGRCFALLLLALFLTKYNYWTLLVAGLLCGALGEFAPRLRAALRARQPLAAWRGWSAAQARHPLTYLLLAAVALALYVRFVGAVSLTLAGRTVTVGSLAFPAALCHALLLARVFPWWWRAGRQAVGRLPVPARQLVLWHGYPLAVWFLWPQRLSAFVWYVTFTQHGRAGDTSPWLGNLAYYWQSLKEDYHANLASLVLALALIALALVGRRRWAKGTGAVLVFLAIAALLTNYHSANRSRFLHSWLAVAWVAAGAGAAFGAERVAGWLGARRPGSGTAPAGARLLGPVGLAAALAGLVILQGPALVGPGHAEEGGPNLAHPSLLGVADAVVPELAEAREPVLVSDSPFECLINWRLGEQRGSHCRLLTPPRELVAPVPREQLAAWLRQHSCDVLLLIDAPFPPVLASDPSLDVGRLRQSLASSGDFTLASEWHDPNGVAITAQVWRRRTAAVARAN